MDTMRRSGSRICLFLLFWGMFCLVDARLTLPSDYDGGNGFGTSVAVSLNDELAISAPDTRAIFIYKQGDNMTWAVTQVISLDQGSEADQFGSFILFGNNFLFIGAPGVLNNAGEVYVYSKIKTDKWEFVQKVNPVPTGGDRSTTFGTSISVSNRFLAVAASSSIFVFKLNETSATWSLLKRFTFSGFKASKVLVTDSILFTSDAKNQVVLYLTYNEDTENFENQRLVNRPYSTLQSYGSGLAYFGGNFLISAPNITFNQSYIISQIQVGYVNETTYEWIALDKWTRDPGFGLLLSTSVNNQRLFIASNYSVAMVNDFSNPNSGAVVDVNGVTSVDSDSKGFVFFGVAGAVRLFQFDAAANSWLEIDGNAPVVPPTNSPVQPTNDLALGLGLGLPFGLLAAAAVIFVVLFLKKKRNQKKKKAEEARKAELARQRETTAGLPRVQSQYNALPAINASESDPMTNTITGNTMAETMALDRLNVPYASLKFNEEIGVGAFGKVFLGEWEHAVVALKIGTVISNQAFFDEAKLMVELRPHPNIVQMYGVSIDGPYPVMILEYCDGGSLDKRLFTKNSSLGQRDELDFAFGIAKGLNYLHKNGIVHRDLAVRNVLLLHGIPKISDFGMSRAVGTLGQGTTKSTVGPIRWMAPESLKTKEYSHPSDVWSYGITLYEIVARQEPHTDQDELNIAVKIRDENYTPPVPEHCNVFLKSIMEKCWNSDPLKRPTMEAICNEFQEYLSSNQA